MSRLAGKVAIITGASQGMGAAHARRFIAEGARVLLADIDSNAGLHLARQLGEAAHKIRANSVHPGYIKTAMMTALLTEEQIVLASGSVPIKRVANPAEVSNLVLFPASDESSFITGAEHIIDGALTAQQSCQYL